jgi:hypothetical protein
VPVRWLVTHDRKAVEQIVWRGSCKALARQPSHGLTAQGIAKLALACERAYVSVSGGHSFLEALPSLFSRPSNFLGLAHKPFHSLPQKLDPRRRRAWQEVCVSWHC